MRPWYGERPAICPDARAPGGPPWQTPPVTPGPPRPTSAALPDSPRPAAGYAVLLGSLALMWGSSYLFIKIGVETLPPLSLVLLRVLVGLAILLAVVAVTRTPLPRDARTIGHLAVLGAVNIAIPFWLISWAEQHISSGLAGILQSTAPFFTLVIAAAFIHDERITPGRLAGIGLGFLGILVLSAENIADFGSALGSGAPARRSWPSSAPRSPMGSGTRTRGGTSGPPGRWSSRRARSVRPPCGSRPGLLVDGGRHAAGRARGHLLRALARRHRHRLRLHGVLPAPDRLGPTRASLVAYLLPVVAVILGVVVLGETIDAFFIAGAVLIVAGVWVVNRRG